MIDEVDCVGLGLACADVCMALDRGTKGRETNGFSRSALEAIEQLTVYVKPAEMHLVHNLLTMPSMAGLRRRSRGRLSSGGNGMRSLDSSVRGKMKSQSPPGGWSSPEFFKSSMWVLFASHTIIANFLFPGSACNKYTCNRF